MTQRNTITRRAAVVASHGRNVERGGQVVGEIEAGGGSAAFYAADLGSLAEVRRLADEVLANHGRLDVLVTNAGIESRANAQAYDESTQAELRALSLSLAGLA